MHFLLLLLLNGWCTCISWLLCNVEDNQGFMLCCTAVAGVFPGSMPKWAKAFWQRHFAQREQVPWSEFKRACEVETADCRPQWNSFVAEQAQQHGGRAGATFMEDVLKVALVSSNGAVTPVSLYLLQVRSLA